MFSRPRTPVLFLIGGAIAVLIGLCHAAVWGWGVMMGVGR
jgi:hypothetical protein